MSNSGYLALSELTRTSLLRKGRAAEPQRSMAMVYSCGQPVGLLALW